MSLQDAPRVLLTTVTREPDYYDYFRENAPRNFRGRLRMPRKISFGLRFLKQNLPQLHILEYPTREQYREALKAGWDVVGFSFYLEETNRILRMAEEARQSGVRELWAGNYGALTTPVQGAFDAIFEGYSENAVAARLGASAGPVRHPPLVVPFSMPGGWTLPVGVLFTSRGCSFQCTFCQTTVFAPRPEPIALESLERVVAFYAARGIHHALLLDENFGNLPAHADAVVDLLARYRMNWLVQSRVDLFLRNFTSWTRRGMEGALFGIESFHQELLAQMQKRERVDAVFELVRRLNDAGLYAHGYFIIGLPSESKETIEQDLKTLAALELDVAQITIVTPHPRTRMWEELASEYGIGESDWSKFDTKHLVWNHPHLRPAELEALLERGFELAYDRRWRARVWKKFLRRRWMANDLGNALAGPWRSRWANPARLPFLAAQADERSAGMAA